MAARSAFRTVLTRPRPHARLPQADAVVGEGGSQLRQGSFKRLANGGVFGDEENLRMPFRE